MVKMIKWNGMTRERITQLKLQDQQDQEPGEKDQKHIKKQQKLKVFFAKLISTQIV